MLVELPALSLGEVCQVEPTRAILKLFDQRCAGLRPGEGIEPWTPDMEVAFNDFMATGRVREYITALNSDEPWGDDQSVPTPGEEEASLHEWCGKLFRHGAACVQVPFHAAGEADSSAFLCRATLTVPLDCANSSVIRGTEFETIKGLLFEYIQWPTLSEIAGFLLMDSWQSLVDQAVWNSADVFANGPLEFSYQVLEFSDQQAR